MNLFKKSVFTLLSSSLAFGVLSFSPNCHADPDPQLDTQIRQYEAEIRALWRAEEGTIENRDAKIKIAEKAIAELKAAKEPAARPPSVRVEKPNYSDPYQGKAICAADRGVFPNHRRSGSFTPTYLDPFTYD
jgi:hypothetical protein